MRREIVEAVRASVRPCMDEDACGNRGLTDEDAEAIARAVLRSALTGEVDSGEWWVVAVASVSPTGTDYDVVYRATGYRIGPFYGAHGKRLALTVAHALNLSRDLVSEANVTSNASIAAGGNDGK